MSNAASPSPSTPRQGTSSQSNQAQSSASGNQSPSNYWVDVMVEFEPAAPEPQDGADRSERYQYLHYLAEQHRAELQAWIEQEGLAAEINHISEATAFDLLFARVTPAAADALQHAPGVVAVMPALDAPAADLAVDRTPSDRTVDLPGDVTVTDPAIYHHGQRLRYA